MRQIKAIHGQGKEKGKKLLNKGRQVVSNSQADKKNGGLEGKNKQMKNISNLLTDCQAQRDIEISLNSVNSVLDNLEGQQQKNKINQGRLNKNSKTSSKLTINKQSSLPNLAKSQGTNNFNKKKYANNAQVSTKQCCMCQCLNQRNNKLVLKIQEYGRKLGQKKQQSENRIEQLKKQNEEMEKKLKNLDSIKKKNEDLIKKKQIRLLDRQISQKQVNDDHRIFQLQTQISCLQQSILKINEENAYNDSFLGLESVINQQHTQQMAFEDEKLKIQSQGYEKVQIKFKELSGKLDEYDKNIDTLQKQKMEDKSKKQLYHEQITAIMKQEQQLNRQNRQLLSRLSSLLIDPQNQNQFLEQRPSKIGQFQQLGESSFLRKTGQSFFRERRKEYGGRINKILEISKMQSDTLKQIKESSRMLLSQLEVSQSVIDGI